MVGEGWSQGKYDPKNSRNVWVMGLFYLKQTNFRLGKDVFFLWMFFESSLVLIGFGWLVKGEFFDGGVFSLKKLARGLTKVSYGL